MMAAAFHFSGHTGIADLDEAYLTLEPLLNHTTATLFGLSLVAAGLSSTVVGTMAGQVVMLGLDPTRILVMSQVLLSFGIALAPLLVFTGNRQLMNELVNSPVIKALGWLIVAVVVTLNIYLLIGTAIGH